MAKAGQWDPQGDSSEPAGRPTATRISSLSQGRGPARCAAIATRFKPMPLVMIGVLLALGCGWRCSGTQLRQLC